MFSKAPLSAQSLEVRKCVPYLLRILAYDVRFKRPISVASAPTFRNLSLFQAMFAGGVYTVLRETDWLAYPKYGAPEPITPFAVEQDPRPSRLFYASAYEIASSAMELGAIFGA